MMNPYQLLVRWLLLPDNTDTLILEALKEKPKCGLDLRDDTRRGFVRIYPALNRLEKRGLVGFYWINCDPGKARKKYYYLARKTE